MTAKGHGTLEGLASVFHQTMSARFPYVNFDSEICQDQWQEKSCPAKTDFRPIGIT